ncbi:winged helix-turn-helix domain-containing protein [Noviherbaspirillum pedocola]|uniref:Winged helix-turn helix domain-containing protein n=1 Tax=Noviherbaspirillum pedocola TaxID=2801341 RepID=A0A934SZJ6_9BURK|nr:hypothetical protein [Noviherbaspirillum pedocola]MBK4738607.1 hypothetical protein [Noviherbaspirillum pedocola]
MNDLTLQQLCAWLHAEHGVRVGITTIWKTVGRLGLSLKKIYGHPPFCNQRFWVL